MLLYESFAFMGREQQSSSRPKHPMDLGKCPAQLLSWKMDERVEGHDSTKRCPGKWKLANVGDKSTIQSPGSELRHLGTDVDPDHCPTLALNETTNLARATAKVDDQTGSGFAEVSQHRLVLGFALKFIEECRFVLARHGIVRRRKPFPDHTNHCLSSCSRCRTTAMAMAMAMAMAYRPPIRRSGARSARLTSVRKQYHFWPGSSGLDAWDVDRLVELSQDLPVVEVPVDSIAEVDSNYWFGGDFGEPTVRKMVEHMRLVRDVDPLFPIILGVDGRVMDVCIGLPEHCSKEGQRSER